jgi:hypothetical protein
MLDDMIALERSADAAIERLPLVQLPARAVLAGLSAEPYRALNAFNKFRSKPATSIRQP